MIRRQVGKFRGMTSKQQREELQQDVVLLRLLEEINDDVLKACEQSDSMDADFHFTEWMLDFWTEDATFLDRGAVVATVDLPKYKINGYNIPQAEDGESEDDSIDIFVSHLVQLSEIQVLTKAQANALFEKARSFFEQSSSTVKRFFEKIDGPDEAIEAARTIFEQRRKISRVRFVLLTNAISVLKIKDEDTEGQRTYSYEILDLERTFKEQMAREPICIDFRSEFGESIPCLKAPNMEAEYTSCLAMIRGEILYKLYKRYGSRLLERNVRSFLQARGKVNKGIKKTILEIPDRFLAYNNGISATAAHIEFKDSQSDGTCYINKITDLQIVNGGQTTAMIYQTHKVAPANVAKIYVPAKITMVADTSLLETIVPEIARCANSQNKIDDSDFLANHVFHTTLQELSRKVGVKNPNGQVFYWYYERAKGQYNEERSRETNRKQFDEKYPSDLVFTKTDVAKFENSWRQLPYIVSRGQQKNFADFDKRFVQTQKIVADEAYFKDLIARAILFRQTNEIIIRQKLGGHTNSTLTYTVALLCSVLNQRGEALNLDNIWKQQSLSDELKALIKTTSVTVQQLIKDTAGTRNVGEWAKKEDCWKEVQTITVDLAGIPENDVAKMSSKLSVPS